MPPHEAAAGAPEVANLVSTIATGAGIAVAAAIAYFRKPAKSKEEGNVAVLSATFSDRQTVDRLSTALDANTACLKRNNELLEAEAQRRHDEAVVREALRSRGISS